MCENQRARFLDAGFGVLVKINTNKKELISWKCLPCWLDFKILEGAMRMLRRKHISGIKLSMVQHWILHAK